MDGIGFLMWAIGAVATLAIAGLIAIEEGVPRWVIRGTAVGLGSGMAVAVTIMTVARA